MVQRTNRVVTLKRASELLEKSAGFSPSTLRTWFHKANELGCAHVFIRTGGARTRILVDINALNEWLLTRKRG